MQLSSTLPMWACMLVGLLRFSSFACDDSDVCCAVAGYYKNVMALTANEANCVAQDHVDLLN